MKTYVPQTQKLIKDAAGIPVFLDVVPETAVLPAISWHNMSTSNDRVLSGIKAPTKIYNRMMIIAKAGTMSAIDPILERLAALDNTKNTDFQRIEIVVNNIEPLQPESPVFRVILDLTLTV